MKNHSSFILSLVVLAFVGSLIFYQIYICESDKSRVKTIISHDARFKNVHAEILGNGVLVTGSVSTTEERNQLLQAINKVKRGRVVSLITTQAIENTP